MSITLYWFRRDLRLEDNAALYHALKSGNNIQPLFIFDTKILDKLSDKNDARVNFIHNTIKYLDSKLKTHGSSLWVFYGSPEEVFRTLIEQHDISEVYTNSDYESYALHRDKTIQSLLGENNIPFHRFKDHVIFEGSEVLKKDGTPYTVFTPYKRKWLERLFDNQQKDFDRFPSENSLSNLNSVKASYPFPGLGDMGFQASQKSIPGKEINHDIIRSYGEKRDFPALKATSRLGLHLRFGTISIRTIARSAIEGSDVFLSELIWRDFYSQILQHFPHVEKNCFRPKYEYIDWRNNETEFKAWCEGKTGYPMVDAGMRELNATGFMHNRSRMITASFLTKHLLIDWRWGEAYFAEKLLDFDLASNNGGWQWAAGCGTDAAPYFRIFNPESQQKKFDKNFEYIKKWVPEWGTGDYATPIVEHKFARERCLEVYKKALNP